MKTIIAGSRGINNYQIVLDAVRLCGWPVTSVLSGLARGVDQLGERYAEDHGLEVMFYPADWATHGKSAGPIRNIEMAESAEALIAIWDGTSKGTAHMIETAKQKGLRVYVHKIGVVA